MATTGFQAKIAVDDDGDGSASGGTSTKFDGLVTFNLPSLEAGKFDATELDQDDGEMSPAADPYERELPTGLIKVGVTKAELHYTKANYLRVQSLVGKRGYTFALTSHDDLSNPGTPVKLGTAFKGFVNKIDEIKFDKGTPTLIQLEVTVQSKPVYS